MNSAIMAERIRAHQGRTVRVQIPAEVAFDLGRFTRMLGNLAERLGCKPCLSGAACFFDLERRFVISPETLKLHAVTEPDPIPVFENGGTVINIG